MLRLHVKAQLCCVSRAEIHEHAFGIFIIWDDTMETRHIENTSVEHFEEMNCNGIFQSDGNSNIVKSRSPISLTENEEIINPLMEQHLADHFDKAMLSSDDKPISSFDLEHHVSVDLTQSKEDEKIQEIVHLNEIEEDGDDEVLESEDVEFGDEDNEVDIMGVPVWRKKLEKILEEFQDAIIRMDKDSLRIIRFPRKENLLDDSRFENWFVIPENVYANEDRLLKDFLDLDSAKGETEYITTISGRERIFTTFHYPLDNTHPKNDIKKKVIEYIESTELQVIYRYEVKSAISFHSPCRNGRARRTRLYITYCYLCCNQCKKFQPKRFILVSILTTLCITPYNVFVIWDTKYNWMMEWQGEDIIKYFWCDYATEVDYNHLRSKLDSHFAKKFYYYDYNRTIPRDYHCPGNVVVCL